MTRPLLMRQVVLDGLLATPLTEAKALGFLAECVKALDMTPIGPATAWAGPDGSVCALQVVAESHVSIHSEEGGLKAHIDVFACKSFDPEMVETLCREYLALVHYQTATLERGCD